MAVCSGWYCRGSWGTDEARVHSSLVLCGHWVRSGLALCAAVLDVGLVDEPKGLSHGSDRV